MEDWIFGVFATLVTIWLWVDRLKIVDLAKVIGLNIFQILEQKNQSEKEMSMKLITYAFENAGYGRPMTEPVPDRFDEVLLAIKSLSQTVEELSLTVASNQEYINSIRNMNTSSTDEVTAVTTQ